MTNVIPRAIADVELQLASAVSIGATSFTLNSANDDDGNALPAGLYCFTLDSGTSNKEYLIGQLNGVNVTSVKTVNRQGAETSGAARAHRVGAPCIVTNFATLQRVADILRGALNLDGASPVSYDTQPSLSDGKQLATVQYVLDTVTGGSVAFDAQIISGLAGETIAAGDQVYFATADQEWYKTDADTAATIEGVQLGIALGSGTNGVAISGGIQIAGTWTTSGLTAGSLYYASNTAGARATSAGTISCVVGLALSTTKLLIVPRTVRISSRQEDAMAGGGDFGTPSAANKFATQSYLISSATSPQVISFTSSGTWTKDAGLKYIIVEGVGGGAGGNGYDTDGTLGPGESGSAGGYFKKLILAASLGATETVTIGAAGTAGQSNPTPTLGGNGGNTSFGSHATGNGGTVGSGGTATGGDVNITGGTGTPLDVSPGRGGNSMLGFGGIESSGRRNAIGYGSGGAGAPDGAGQNAGTGAPGIVIVTEYYS